MKMKKFFIALFLFVISHMGVKAAVYKSIDSQMDCIRYEVISKIKGEDGISRYERETLEGEELLSEESLYGLTVQDVDIDFDNREANFIIVKNVILGFNNSFFEDGRRNSIDSEHKDFKEMINQVNKKVRLIKSVCINTDNIIKDVKFEESKRNQ